MRGLQACMFCIFVACVGDQTGSCCLYLITPNHRSITLDDIDSSLPQLHSPKVTCLEIDQLIPSRTEGFCSTGSQPTRCLSSANTSPSNTNSSCNQYKPPEG